MYSLPEVDGGEMGPTKSIPTWCHGEWTGTGWSSGVVVVTFPFTRWHTSQVETFKDNLKASYYY